MPLFDRGLPSRLGEHLQTPTECHTNGARTTARSRQMSTGAIVDVCLQGSPYSKHDRLDNYRECPTHHVLRGFISKL
jgi:hypothetical protein